MVDREDTDPPPGIQRYEDLSEVPWNIQKYYHQRYSIFSAYDDGIWMTEDAWFGVTPEPVATKIAQHVSQAAASDRSILIDCFAGVGGNTIAFALTGRWMRIYAIEKDPKALLCAKHNAEIYGVQDRISWYEGDAFEIIKDQLKDVAPYSVIFGSPPWGGPGYRNAEIFDLSTMQPYNLEFLYDSFTAKSSDVVLYLPRTSDLRQLAELTSWSRDVTVMHYCMEGASKAICAYFGDFDLSCVDK